MKTSAAAVGNDTLRVTQKRTQAKQWEGFDLRYKNLILFMFCKAILTMNRELNEYKEEFPFRVHLNPLHITC